MDEGITWLAEPDRWQHTLVFARGITPGELAVRMGGIPGSVTAPVTDGQAWDLVYDPSSRDEDVVRVGEHGAWSFAVEYGLGDGAARLADVSAGGVEAINLDPCADHPPSMFHYANDGHLVCGFGIGEEVWRWGTQPDLLLPELIAASILDGDGEYIRPDDEPFYERDRCTLALIETRFGLSLPHDVLAEEPLPAFVIA
ncbi:DUF6461 domain-containing protein [Streptomyces sp. NPDC014746]|uniref:DUF6461 domain-containing protein n=1 Tax=Streptomyces sp. NPDC014746 TaxID=3364904 RepID=UPI0036FCE69D